MSNTHRYGSESTRFTDALIFPRHKLWK